MSMFQRWSALPYDTLPSVGNGTSKQPQCKPQHEPTTTIECQENELQQSLECHVFALQKLLWEIKSYICKEEIKEKEKKQTNLNSKITKRPWIKDDSFNANRTRLSRQIFFFFLLWLQTKIGIFKDVHCKCFYFYCFCLMFAHLLRNYLQSWLFFCLVASSDLTGIQTKRTLFLVKIVGNL